MYPSPRGVRLIFIALCVILGWGVKAQIQEQLPEISLEDLIYRLKIDKDIVVAHDPLAIQGMTTNSDCLLAMDVGKCILAAMENQFDVVILNDKEIMLRRKEMKPTRQVRLHVVDDISGQPLSFAEIWTVEGQLVSIVDSSGYAQFDFDAQEQPVPFQIQYIGYDPHYFTISAKEDYKVFRLKVKPFEGRMTEVVAALPRVMVAEDKAAITMSAELSASVLAAVVGDVLRGLQILPGISATHDYSSALKIRGGDGSQNLVLLDDIPMYKTGHFYNLFSIVNDDPIHEIKLFKNYFNVEDGEATTGILKLDLKNPLQSEPEIRMDANLLTSDAFASFKIGDKFGVLLSGRTSYNNVAQGGIQDLFSDHFTARTDIRLSQLNAFQSSIIPEVNFQDYTSKIAYAISPTSDMSATFFYAKDKVKLSNTFDIQGGNNQNDLRYKYESTQNWSNSGIGYTLNHQWNSNFNSTLQAYYSEFDRSDTTLNSLVELGNGSEGQGDGRNDNLSFLLNDKISDASITWYNTHYLSNKLGVTWGYQGQFVQTEYDIVRPNEINQLIGRSSHLHNLFASTQFSISTGFHIDIGTRLAYSSLQNEWSVSPRFQLNWECNEKVSLKTSAGSYKQYLRSLSILNASNLTKEIWSLANGTDIPTLKSNLLMLGGTWITDFVTVDLEIYGRFESGVMQEVVAADNVTSQANLSAINPRLFVGEGRRWGLDLMIKKDEKRYSSFLAYSLSKGEVSFDEFGRGEWNAAADDRRHEIKWYNTAHIGRFDLHLNGIYASGYPQYSLDFGGNAPNRRNAAIKAYERIDLGADYNFNIGGSKTKIGFSVFNVFDRQNTSSTRFAGLSQIQQNNRPTYFTEEIDLLGRTFNVRFQIAIK